MDSGDKENLWEESLELIDDHDCFFNFTQLACSLNFLNEEMREGAIAPTDSRHRLD